MDGSHTHSLPTEEAKETVAEIAKLIAGLSVPVSLGMGSDGLLGTAFEPWQKLYNKFGGGWSSAEEIEKKLSEVLL
jgi:hypothetical protein